MDYMPLMTVLINMKVLLMIVIAYSINVEFPADLRTDDTVSSNDLQLPEGSSITANTAVMNECIAESMDTESLTTEFLTVDTISAIDSDLYLYGKLQVTGEIVYQETLIQQSMQSFLQISREKDWKEVGVGKETKNQFKLREHDYLMMYSNARFNAAFDGETLQLMVDGRIAWMETYVAFNNTGEYTAPIKAVLKHNADTATVEFLSTSDSGYSVDTLILFSK